MAETGPDIDTDAVRIIRGSRVKLILLAVLALAFTLLCLALAFEMLPLEGEDREAGMAFGWIGALFFGACLMIVMRRFAGWSRAVIEISPDGIRDRRLSAELVRWDEVTDVAVLSMKASSFVQIALVEDAERRLFKSPGARALSLVNKAVGFSGLAINAAGTDIDTNTLAGVCDAYWQAHRPRSGESTHV